MKKEVIIVAGGVGKRFGAQIPKQFLTLGGEIILIRTIRLFYELIEGINIIVTLPEKEFQTWGTICKEEGFKIPHKLVKGGKTRFHSVKNALEEISNNTIVAIHDGVRPLVSGEIVLNAFNKAEELGNAIPVSDIHESIRYSDGTKNYPVNRENYKIIQTPQVFRSNQLLLAYEADYRKEFTDDASVLELSGKKVHLIKGNPENIKITTKKDLAIAETLLEFMNK